MKSEKLKLFIVVLKALESSPYRDLAKQLRDQLENEIEEVRYDYEGNKHECDLRSFIARFPNYKYISRLLANQTNSLLESTHKQPPKRSVNIFHRLRDRTLHGPTCLSKTIPVEYYTRFRFCTRSMGHLAAVYCVAFDQTGQFILTGSDDHLIKIWCAHTFRLLRTFRGHTGELCDMSINFENRLLATAGTDKIIRIWDLKSTKLLECLQAHTAVITSVKFCPYIGAGDIRYMVSTSNDGSIIIWKYHVDKVGFEKYARINERNRVRGQITCSSFSTGGVLLACGASDNYIHVYGFTGPNPYHIAELCGHKDSVESLQFSNHGNRFVSGSKDGTAVIWTHKNGRFKPLALNMYLGLDQQPQARDKKDKPLRVQYVQWSRDDRYVITAVSDMSIKIWDSRSGKLIHSLSGHESDVYHIDNHPEDHRIFVSASHDGTFCIWDILTGELIKRYKNFLDPVVPNQGHTERIIPAIFDMKFSPDGNTIATTDSHGYLTVYRLGSHNLYQVPDQMFFNTDYAHLIHDLHNFAMDEATHMAPHLLTTPYLVDMNAEVYPNEMQALVTDYQGGSIPVVPALTAAQQNTIYDVIKSHSDREEVDLKKNYVYDENYDSDATIVDSEATEIDDNYLEDSLQAYSGPHNLRSMARRRIPCGMTREMMAMHNNIQAMYHPPPVRNPRPQRRITRRSIPPQNVAGPSNVAGCSRQPVPMARRSPRTKRLRRSDTRYIYL